MYKQLIWAIILSGSATTSWSNQVPEDKPESAAYTRVYCGEDGQTHLERAHIDFTVRNYAPPARPSGVSKSMGANSVTFLSLPVGYVGQQHPAPRRQFIISLSGTTEIEAGDGGRETLGPGDFVLLEDTDCAGHVTKAIGDVPATGVAIPLTSE
jgi:hypothetical protein